ncbi:MAG TPA: phytanoyl-CoA dioxygenase family protein [Limnochordia bacterium]|nr:phytanoyl-CoA dioxygenase family protein [Limnochordia bacterium]
MQLTHAQKEHIREHGYVKVPGAVPKLMVDQAVRAINHSLGQEGMDPAQMTKFRAQSYCPEVQRQPAITDLFNRTPVIDLVRSVLGEENVRPAGSGQIALRFPTLQDPVGEARPHLDGMYSPHNGVKEGTISNFTMLVGIALSDLPGPYAGNLAVWPGSHRKYEAFFQEHGPEALLKGMPPLDIGPPTHITAQAGDALLCHYQLAHGVAPNASPNVRYAIYFRVTSAARTDWQTPMKSIWHEWPGM